MESPRDEPKGAPAVSQAEGDLTGGLIELKPDPEAGAGAQAAAPAQEEDKDKKRGLFWAIVDSIRRPRFKPASSAAPGRGPAAAAKPGRPVPQWSDKGFKRSLQQMERDLDSGHQWKRLWDFVSHRPALVWGVYASVAAIVVFDLAAIMRRVYDTDPLSVAIYMLPRSISERIAPPESWSGRIFLGVPRAEPARTRTLQPVQAAVVAFRPSSIEGILTPEELKHRIYRADVPVGQEALARSASVSPVPAAPQASGAGDGRRGPAMARTQVVSVDRSLPAVRAPERSGTAGHGPGDIQGQSPEGRQTAEEAGEGADDLLAEGIEATDGYSGPAGDDAMRGFDDDLRGEDLMDDVLGRDSSDLNYGSRGGASGGQWKPLRNLGKGYKTPSPDLSTIKGRGLKSSYAIRQLVETATVAAGSYFCNSCSTENRVNNNRSTFFGEPYKKTSKEELQ